MKGKIFFQIILLFSFILTSTNLSLAIGSYQTVSIEPLDKFQNICYSK